MVVAACPDLRELCAYDQGLLAAAEIDALSRHFEHCPRCVDLLEEVEQRGDRLVELLRGAEPSPSDALGLAALIERAVEIPASTFPESITHWTSPSPPTADLPANMPTELGQYRILSELGRGGMGAVYKALHQRLDKLVALKVIAPERLNDRHTLVRFEREMKAVGKLRHPGVVAAHDAGEAQGRHFLVMELVEGTDLSTLVHRQGPLPIDQACQLAAQVADGLVAIHEHGLVHRDIKPSNLMLTPAGEIKILDLGLALLRSGSEVTGARPSSRVLGTADYLAPEQARDSRSVDIRADLYSLGCTLVKLLTGEAPYPSPQFQTTEQKLAAHRQAPVPDVRQRRPEIPVKLVEVIERLLAKNPDDRYRTPAEAAAALRMLRFSLRRREAAGEEGERRSRRQLLIAAAMLLPITIAAYFLTGEGSLTLHLPEPGIEILIDGRETSSGVRFLPDRVERHLRVPAGHHELLVSKPGHKPFATSFWLVRHGQRRFEITLPRDPPAIAVVKANSGPPIPTTDPDGAWEVSVRTRAGMGNDPLYVPLKSDWSGSQRTGMVQDAIFWGPFAVNQADSIWIFRTNVDAEAATKVDVFFGHDDGGAMYLNGELVTSSGTTAGRFGHLAFTGPLEFRAGRNTVEIAVYVAQGASSINLGAIAPNHAHALSQVPGLSLRAPP